MAGFKVSEFSGVANTTDDSLLLLSYTTDNGATFATRKIRIADFLDDIDATTKADVGVDHLETLTGAGADAEHLGTFAGSTIADNSAGGGGGVLALDSASVGDLGLRQASEERPPQFERAARRGGPFARAGRRPIPVGKEELMEPRIEREVRRHHLLLLGVARLCDCLL